MKKFIVIAFLIFFNSPSFSQDTQLSGDSLQIISRAYTFAQNHDSALYYLDLAGLAFKREGNLQSYYMAKISSSYEHYQLGKLEDALDVLDIVTQEGEEHIADWIMGVTYRLKGEILGETGEFDRAVETLEMALDKIGDVDSTQHQRSKVGVFMGLGNLYSLHSYFGKAEIEFQKAIPISEKLPARANSTYELYINLADLMLKTGSMYKAIEYQNNAIESSNKNLADPTGHLSLSYQGLGDIYSKLMMNEKALEYYQKALDTRRSLAKDSPYSIDILLGIGAVHSNSGNHDLAFKFRQEALDLSILVSGNKSQNTAEGFNAIGLSFLESHNYQLAIKNFHKASEINMDFSKTDNFGQAVADFWLGFSQLKLNQDDEGRKNISSGLKMLKRVTNSKNTDLAKFMNLIAQDYVDREILDSAQLYFQKALIANSSSFENTAPESNPVLEDFINGLQLFESFLGKMQTLELKFLETNNKEYLGQAYKTSLLANELSSLLRQQPSSHTDKLSLQSLISNLNEIGLRISYDLYVQTDDQNYLNTAYQFGEKNKANLILVNINERLKTGETGVPDSIVFIEQDLHGKISYYRSELHKLNLEQEDANKALIGHFESELFEANIELDRILNTLKSNYSSYYQAKYAEDFISIKKIQKSLLDPNDLLLHYSRDESYIYRFQISHQDFEVHRIPIIGEFESEVSNYLELLQNPGSSGSYLSDFLELSNHLSNILLPSPGILANYDNLIIVPDGMITLIPFETFSRSRREEVTSFKDVDYLLKTHSIVYASSATLLSRQEEHNKRFENEGVLAFAPVFDDESLLASEEPDTIRDGLGTLAWTQDEVSNIGNHFETLSLMGQEATERQFRALSSNYSVVHVASHGVLDEDNPMYSKLVFSPYDRDSINDGYLNTQEIFNMDIPAEMVVLSACNTGLGEVISGEGVLSLASGFFYAGAKSLAMTLWTANDESTANIMNDFYKNLADKQTKGDALRNAKLSHLENADALTSHPYYWAHFVVNGNNEPIVVGSKLWVYLIIIGLLAAIGAVQSRMKKTTI